MTLEEFRKFINDVDYHLYDHQEFRYKGLCAAVYDSIRDTSKSLAIINRMAIFFNKSVYDPTWFGYFSLSNYPIRQERLKQFSMFAIKNKMYEAM